MHQDCSRAQHQVRWAPGAPSGQKERASPPTVGRRANEPTTARLRALSAARHVHIGWLQDGGHARRVLARDGVSLSQDVSVNAAPEDLGVEGLAIAGK